ncbi:amidase [Rhodococcus oryzae]|uniref:amidase n=1 Tax=Rhodococcus oryzae TaxID=2571143 RepID=UPI0037182F5F
MSTLGVVSARGERVGMSGSIAKTDPALLSAVEAASLLQSRELHPRELLDAYLSRSADLDGEVSAWVRIYPELAYEQADRAAQRLSAAEVARHGAAPLVCGLPIALKDLFAVEGLPLTASSRVLAGNIAAGNATVVQRLSEAGMVLMGHAHTHEFAIGSCTPQVGNPWDTTASVGGSSGGSAAVVAARFAPLATGTDTGGSIRLPASVCGVSAIKPTYGLCSSYGVIPGIWSRDHVGSIGHSIADAALLLGFMAGFDPQDPVTATAPALPDGGYPLVARGGRNPLAGRRFGLPNGVGEALPGALAAVFEGFLGLVRELGGEIVGVEMPPLPEGMLPGDYIEAGAYHRQFSDRTADYEPMSAAMMGGAIAMLAAPVSEYWDFQRSRAAYQRAYNRMLAENRLDCVLLPGTKLDGVKRPENVVGDVEWANYSGAPALCIPAGRSAETGIPFGVQLGGRPWDEAGLIAMALELQEAQPIWREVATLPDAPRQIPAVSVGTPGAGPDPTNTDAAPAAFRIVATTATDRI